MLFQAEEERRGHRGKLLNITSADGERSTAFADRGGHRQPEGAGRHQPERPGMHRALRHHGGSAEGRLGLPVRLRAAASQDARSAKDVEQLLGRVLRMPYARPRLQTDMGKAYAHIVAEGFARVADSLADRLVNNMGLSATRQPRRWPRRKAFAGGRWQQRRPKPAEAIVALPAMPTAEVPAALRDTLELRPTSSGATAIVRGELSAEVEDSLTSCKAGKQQDAVKDAIEHERMRQAALLAPSARGVRFAPLPQLCLDFDGALQPVEQRMLAELGQFDLFAEPVSLANFDVRERGTCSRSTWPRKRCATRWPTARSCT
ncbi:hypothetical protein [Thermomonas sp.]|uniref:hypothetical protein n=1 Tax=Thermomonas sp. TaxID=1971895 RepID=UPI002620BC7D|nr:hypothetical protein [Thermomonas sp.]MCO5054672.1 hypothetical protein [Thermomonas sp.]